MRFSRDELEVAANQVMSAMLPTPQHSWPLLNARLGFECWLKHENHAPTGAFKVRGGLVHLAEIAKARPDGEAVIAATRGNHGQSVAYAARANRLRAVVVVPRGNSRTKNAAMRAYGAELIEHGADFNEALDHARRLAAERELHFVPSFGRNLVRGVASYALELFRGAPPLDRVYVPIGLGSGICGVLAARDALGLATEVVGVVSEKAPTYKLSFEAERPVETGRPDTMADGLAVRVPDPEALAVILAGAARVVTVSDAEIETAIRDLFDDTHNVVEGAGAAGVAAARKEARLNSGKRVGTIVTGGNIDREVYARIIG